MRADKFFTEEEKVRIREAVIEAESKTAGEIVPMLVTSSARYTEVELLGTVIGLFVGIIIEWFWSDPWGSHFFNLWPAIGDGGKPVPECIRVTWGSAVTFFTCHLKCRQVSDMLCN